MTSEPGYAFGATALAPMSFTFTWDAVEHRRTLRDISRHRERSTGQSIFWWAVAAVLGGGALVTVLAAMREGSVRPIVSVAPWLAFIAAWAVLRAPVNGWFAARHFRAHNPAVAEPIGLRFDGDGVHTTWGSQSATVRWDGVRRVVETERVFLFFISPASAQFLPTRAVGSAAEREALRRLIRREKGGAAELREG